MHKRSLKNAIPNYYLKDGLFSINVLLDMVKS